MAVPPLLRCDSGGDLSERVFVSHHGSSPLQKERDVPEPGGENSQSGRRPRAGLQQLTERSQRKPEGVFYLVGAAGQKHRD